MDNFDVIIFYQDVSSVGMVFNVGDLLGGKGADSLHWKIFQFPLHIFLFFFAKS